MIVFIYEGILARAEGWHIIMHLQKLVDDGNLSFEYLIVALYCVSFIESIYKAIGICYFISSLVLYVLQDNVNVSEGIKK